MASRYIIDNPEPPDAWQGLSSNIQMIGKVLLEKKMKDQQRKQEQQDAIELYREKLKAQSEMGGPQTVNIVDPVTGEVKTIYVPTAGGKQKTYLHEQPAAPAAPATPRKAPIDPAMMQQAQEATPYLKGLPGVLERFMPFGGEARKGVVQQKYNTLTTPAAQPQGKLMGQAPQQSQANPYQDEYPDAFQEGGVWKVMRNGKKYRIEE